MGLLVVGSVAYDGIETPEGSVDRVLGGAGSYIALAASHFTKVQLVAVVGDDFSVEDEAILSRKNVDLEGLERARGKTFYWSGIYSEDMNERRTLTTELNVFAEFKPRLPAAYRKADQILLGNIDPMLQSSVLRQVDSSDFVAGDTMNYWIECTPRELASAVATWDLIMVNDEEALMMTGARNLRVAARRLQEMGPEAAVIKRGEHGAALFSGDDCCLVPGYPLRSLVDPTGAGDAFAGGFMGYLASRKLQRHQPERFADLCRAMVYGSVTASACCEGFGVTALDRLSHAAIERRFEEFRQMTSY